MARPRISARAVPAVVLIAALALAGVSLVFGQSLRFDAHGWLAWGRQIALGDGPFTTTDYPSWKPLPVLATVPLAWCGSLGPVLWLVLARAGGFLALFIVFVLARRRAGPAAGAVAVGSLALTPAWWPTLAGGAIEPLLVAFGGLAVMCHEGGRPRLVLALLCLMSLGREEAAILLVLYGACLARQNPRWLLAAVLLATGVVAAWMLGDWLGSGDPLHGGALARAAPDAVALRATGAPLWAALPQITDLLLVPLWASAAFGLVAAIRTGDRTLIAVIAAGLVWTTADLVLVSAGYPLQERFLFPAAAAFSLAAGIGIRAALIPAHARWRPLSR